MYAVPSILHTHTPLPVVVLCCMEISVRNKPSQKRKSNKEWPERHSHSSCYRHMFWLKKTTLVFQLDSGDPQEKGNIFGR